MSTSVLIGAGVLTGVFSNPEARRFALDKLNGQVLPVPGVNWLHLELNTGGDNLMLGMHLDIGQLLPPSLGFGPSSPSAIGGVPQPEPLLGQRMIQRQEDNAEVGAGEAIAERIQAASGSGGQLDEGVQQHLEQHLGADLSGVRIHTDGEADRLSRSVNAVAFTTGQDIFFSAGSYNPSSSEGKHLIAHEVVHTVQQANGAVAGTPTAGGVSISDPSDSFEQEAEQVALQVMNVPDSANRPLIQYKTTIQQKSVPMPLIQREPPATASPATTTLPAPGGSAANKTVTYDGKTLHADSVMAKQMLQNLIGAEGYKAAEALLDKLLILFGAGDQAMENAFKGQDLETAKLCVKTTVGHRFAIQQDRDKVLAEFEAKAKEKTYAILKESEKRINAERERYGIPEPKTMRDRESGANIDITPHKMDNNEATNALVPPAAELVPPRKKLEALFKSYESCLESIVSNNQGPMPNKRVIPGKEEEAQNLDSQIQEARRQIGVLRASKEKEFPILAAYGPEGEANTASLENIARGTASQGLAFWRKNAADELVPMIVEKLHNIQTVRASIDDGRLKIWSNATLVAGAKADLSYSPGAWQTHIVDDKVKEVHDEEFLVNLLVATLAIGLGIVAIFATAGSATAAVAAGGSAILSTGQAAVSIDNYIQAKAEAGTDFDKAKAISQEDPSLFWLALDLIAAALDIKAATSSFKVLSPAIREALATGKSPEALGKLGKILDKYDPILKQKILMHITGATDIGKPVLEEMEKIARAQYKAMADAGKLKEIGDISEEVFVQQMLSGARSHMIISGEEGVRRSGLLAALMKPGNERIAAILNGDVKAIDGLIMEHGNWKQLLGMLDQGTPEMRQAAAKLFDRRQSLLPQLESKFHAKPVSGASSERISDIDLSTYGADAGSDLINAEKYMQSLYGTGWSEALRMNFYTEAGRLTLYEKLLPGLSEAERAAVLGQVTADAEKLNISKMLAHAEGNPARIAEVEAYAKKIGVDIKDPKIQELVTKLTGGGSVEARNKLLLEVDELMKQYNAANPGSKEQLDLARTITAKQMEVNALTAEAYIGPGAGRMTVSGVKVIGHEAYQAALSNLEMIQHILHEMAGDVVTASREYEIYKYINRFAEAVENAGAKTQGLDYWKNFSGFASKTERQATSGSVHLGPRPNATVPKGGQPFLPDTNPRIGPVSDLFLQQQYEAWKSFSEQALGDIKKISQEQPAAWAGFNPPRPAAGVPAPQ
ncbi:MAG: DUF4157 domain-containing protein [Richelia sp. RM2_1_2]|nr:DUF4157 domain-containing protein [Richelia sp. RM2_1_2]